MCQFHDGEAAGLPEIRATPGVMCCDTGSPHLHRLETLSPLPPRSVVGEILFNGQFGAFERPKHIGKAEMMNRRSALRGWSLLLVVAMIAVGCGGSESTEAPVAAAADVPTTAAEIPTTPPVSLGDDTAAADTTDAAANEAAEQAFATPEPANEWENIVLVAKDNVQIVPTFLSANGPESTIYDVNAIDGVEQEYPLFAQTHFGNRLALRVEEFDSSGNWAKVQVPVRPNGTTTWVQTAFFDEQRHNYHITIDLSENKVNVYDGDELLVEQISVLGRESRPTPVVRSYIDEKIDGESIGPAYGTWILSIAAFSESMGTFGGGGMPKLALHGTNQPDLMGQYISSGCIRIPNDVIDFIADRVPVGTVVDIVP